MVSRRSRMEAREWRQSKILGGCVGWKLYYQNFIPQIVLTVVEQRSKDGRGRCVRRIGVAVDLKVEAW